MKREELTGDWWLPSAPERQVAGTLSYKPDGYPELKLRGALSDGKESKDRLVVLGRTGDGPVTAEIDFQTNLARGFSCGVETVHQSFAVRLAIVGAHLPGPSDRRYSQISLDLTGIWPWTGWHGPTGRGSTPGEVTITYSRPPELIADLEWGRVRLFGTHSESYKGWAHASLEVGARFLCERAEAAPMEAWLAEVVGPLRDFLSIATDRASQVVEIGVILPDEHAYGRVIYSAMHVDLPPHPALPFDFPFTAVSIADEFGSVLGRWFELRRRQGRALALYLSTQYRASDLAETRFLNVAGAAEAYHRRTTGPRAVPEGHKQRVDRIVAALASTDLARRDRALVRWRLRKGDEPTLESRLTEMARRCENVLQPSLGDPAAFGKRVAATRNLMVHSDPSHLAGLPDGRTIIDMFEDVGLVFLVCLYQDLGFQDDTIKTMLRRTWRWRFLEYRKRAWFGEPTAVLREEP